MLVIRLILGKVSITMRVSRLLLPLILSVSLVGGCGDSHDDGIVRLSVIGKPADLSEPLAKIRTTPARVLLGATAQGLVTLDETGEVVPALAQRWIVADDGRSYIFRLRRVTWADGSRVDARQVARLLLIRTKAAALSDPYTNMAAVRDVLAMTTDVIEIRLSAPRPNFLAMLAQPQMAIARSTGGTGPYRKRPRDGALLLTLPPSEDAGEGSTPTPPAPRLIRAESAVRAIARYKLGYVDLVLGGTLSDLPYVKATGRLKPNALQLDPATGLFGLAFHDGNPLLASPQARAAISMAIDRDQIVKQLGVKGWSPVITIMPTQFNLAAPSTLPDWAGLSLDERRARAAATIATLKAGSPSISLELGDGPGDIALFRMLAADLARIGLSVRRVPVNGDLTLIDDVAPYDSGFWYLGRISCARKISCDPQAEAMLADATTTQGTQQRSEKLSQAEALIAAHGGYIPLATPLRWSLINARMTGWRPSARAWHPLLTLTNNRDKE